MSWQSRKDVVFLFLHPHGLPVQIPNEQGLRRVTAHQRRSGSPANFWGCFAKIPRYPQISSIGCCVFAWMLFLFGCCFCLFLFLFSMLETRAENHLKLAWIWETLQSDNQSHCSRRPSCTDIFFNCCSICSSPVRGHTTRRLKTAAMSPRLFTFERFHEEGRLWVSGFLVEMFFFFFLWEILEKKKQPDVSLVCRFFF